MSFDRRQHIEAQRQTLGGGFEKEFKDEGVWGAVPAARRPDLSQLLSFVREGDTLHVYAVDRLGRDIQQTVRALLNKGVAVHVHGLYIIAKGVGELIMAVLAQVADMERQRVIERTTHGRQGARESLAATERTHRGKKSLGRSSSHNATEVMRWRSEGKHS